jgi:hypothetical protein
VSYLDIWNIAQDPYLRSRITACAAQEGVATPDAWAYSNSLQIAASPGWAAAWASALAAGNENPGKDEAVITDGMVLAAVQGRLAT